MYVMPTTKKALDALRALSPRERRQVMCWFCDACAEYIGPGAGHRCKMGSAVYPPAVEPKTKETKETKMDRRTFVGAAITLSLVPATARAANPRLVELEKELRERYGSDADAVMEMAQTLGQEVVAEYPDLSRDSEEDLDFLTDVTMERVLERLEAAGVELR